MSRSAVFLVKLSKVSKLPVSINFATVAGTAVAPSDFTSVSGTITFAPGQTIAQVIVPVRNNIPGWSEESFKLVLSNPANANLRNAIGECVLPGVPVDSQPVISIDNITVPSL